MVETVGRKLQRARIARGLKIEEVADATKIRPERIIDLEADEYGHFANLTYAKSFLAKYAKFLGVDIQEELDHFQVSSSISLRDYQYLASSNSRSIRKINAKGFRVPPLVVVLLVLVLLVGVPLFSYMAINIPQLRDGALEGRAAQDQFAAAAPTPAVAGPAASGSPGSLAGMPQGAQSSAANPAPGLSSSAQVDNQAAASPSAPPISRTEGGVEVRRAMPISPPGPADDHPGTTGAVHTADLTAAPQTKLELRVLKRTYVKVTKDEEDSEPVFDGFAGPDQPIVVEGKRFWLKIHDKGAVEVRKNGQRVLNSSDDVVID